MLFIELVVLLAQIILAGLVGYLLVLTFASTRASKNTLLRSHDALHRFLILIPAHNEEKLIGSTLENLAGLDYPADFYEVHVVADNCSDHTARIAREKGATVHERFDPNMRGKGYALQWLLNSIWEARVPHDAVVILDADSFLSANFLKVMDARLELGQTAIQAYYTVRDPGNSAIGSLRYAALAAIHYLRPQGRMMLGGSAGLKGNGMVFAADLMKQFEWSASVTEDIDLHMSLITNGFRVMFAPDAVVRGEMPDTFAGSESQTVRWESGRIQMARQYAFPLLKLAWTRLNRQNKKQAFLLADAALEHLIPPFTILVALCGFFAVIDTSIWLIRRGWVFQVPRFSAFLVQLNFWAGILLLVGLAVYLFSALRLVQAPGFIYRNLLASPLFAVWKIGQYLKILFGKSQTAWVRTARNEERNVQ